MTRQRIAIGLTLGLALILLAALPHSSFAQVCTDPPAGLISWWPGEGGLPPKLWTHLKRTIMCKEV
ncbi:MAG: hypothetical protein V3T42_00120, partial [Nitrospirales bacterium]